MVCYVLCCIDKHIIYIYVLAGVYGVYTLGNMYVRVTYLYMVCVRMCCIRLCAVCVTSYIQHVCILPSGV